MGIAAKPGGQGYLLASADGEVFPFGAPRSYGSMRGRRINHQVVGIAYTPSSRGYFIVASDGGIFTFGDARFRGSTGSLHLHAPIVGMAVTSTGTGYWLVAADGGIFTFGDAPFRGSLGAKHLNAPIVGMAATHTGHGYWLVGRDGTVYRFGDALFFGSAKGRISGSAVAISASPTGAGYLVTSRFGFSAAFGDAPDCSNFPFFPGPIGPGIRFKGSPGFGFAFPGPGSFDTVGIAIPFDPSALHTFLAGSCGGPSMTFHATTPWHIDFTAPGNPAFQSYCNVIVERPDISATGQNLTLDEAQGEAPGRLEIRSAQVAGNTTYRILSESFCLAIARPGAGGTQPLPFTTTTGGDSLPFTSALPITIDSSNIQPCQLEVFANSDGHFVDGHYGSHAHLVVAPGGLLHPKRLGLPYHCLVNGAFVPRPFPKLVERRRVGGHARRCAYVGTHWTISMGCFDVRRRHAPPLGRGDVVDRDSTRGPRRRSRPNRATFLKVNDLRSRRPLAAFDTRMAAGSATRLVNTAIAPAGRTCGPATMPPSSVTTSQPVGPGPVTQHRATTTPGRGRGSGPADGHRRPTSG